MLLAGFEPVFPTNERPQTHALDRVAAEIGLRVLATVNNKKINAHSLYQILIVPSDLISYQGRG